MHRNFKDVRSTDYRDFFLEGTNILGTGDCSGKRCNHTKGHYPHFRLLRNWNRGVNDQLWVRGVPSG